MKISKCLSIILALISLSVFAQEGTYRNGQVIRVTDGDTIVINDSGDQVKIRLFGIDGLVVVRTNIGV